MVYLKRKRKLKEASSPDDVAGGFWNDTYEELPAAKGQILQPPNKNAPSGSKLHDEVVLDDLSGKTKKGEMKETEDDLQDFDEDMNSLRLQFENPMFESSA